MQTDLSKKQEKNFELLKSMIDELVYKNNETKQSYSTFIENFFADYDINDVVQSLSDLEDNKEILIQSKKGLNKKRFEHFQKQLCCSL